MIEFHKKVGKTFLYYGFTVEKKYNDQLKKLYGLSVHNLQTNTKLHILDKTFDITIRMVDQNRSKTVKLQPEDHKPRHVIQISYQFNQDLLAFFKDTFRYSNSMIFDRELKIEHPEFALFRIEGDGLVYCIPHLSKRERF